MSWSAEHAWPAGTKLVAPGMGFTLWDYQCARGEDRLATNDTHVVSMMLSGDCDALVRHDLGERYSDFERLGSLLMTPAHVPIHTIGMPFRTRVARLEIAAGRFATLDRIADERAPEKLARCVNIPSQAIRDGMRRLSEEAIRPGSSAALLVEGIGITVVAELIPYLDQGSVHVALDGPVAFGGFTPMEIRSVTDYVEANLTRQISVADMAALFDLSPRHFARRFRVATGSSVHKFVEEARLRQARTLLADRRLSIKEIAFRLGYARSGNFSDAFFRKTGERPGAYRRRQVPSHAKT
ncbi:MAG TPA: AraC family transcriptional regulator [Sphingobium sp.]|uniref:AraC family transcriptional regulator n=1 Tax=Sphingobium sp. TaxID=1912891 RepID=UPI002ED46B29